MADANPPEATTKLDGRPARSVASLTGMLGWNSIGVFSNSANFDGDTLHVNRGAVLVVLTDPYPEYKQFVYLDGEFHHSGDLLSMEYEGVFEDHINCYGEAEVYPLNAVDAVERDDHGIPRHVEPSNRPEDA